MQKIRPFSIANLVALFLLFSGSFATAQITGGTNTINSPYIGSVVGNNGGIIPSTTGDTRTVYGNELIINSTVSVNAHGGGTYGTGDVYKNTVTVNSGATVSNQVRGGSAGSSVADSGNANIYENLATVNIGGTVNGQIHGGYTSGIGEVRDNTVIIYGQTNDTVAGGWLSNDVSTADMYNNKVIVDGTVNGTAYGSVHYGLGKVFGSIVNVSGTVNGSVIGSYLNNSSNTEDTSSNIVTIEIGGSAYNVYGSRSYSSGAVTMNIVTIEGTVENTGVETNVCGGRSLSGTAIANEVNISGSVGSRTSMANVIGGYSSVKEANANDVNILANATIIGNVIGGESVIDDAIGNKVEISGSVISINSSNPALTSYVYGGRGGDGMVTDNVVIVNSGGVAHIIIGGASTGNAVIKDNKVTLLAGAIATDSVFGGYTDGDGNVTSNTVSIASGSSSADGVYGGYAKGNGHVTSNSVEIFGSAISAYGGYTYGIGHITDNTVSVTGSGSVDYVFGGYADGDGNISGNSIKISGTVSSEVYGGYTSGTGTANNNTVNIESSANLANASLFGRNNNSGGGSSNTLNVNSFVGDVVEINNFDTYNITIGELDSSLTVINITGSTPVDIDNAKINIYFAPECAYNILAPNQEIIVISSINLPTYVGNDPTIMVEQASPFFTYDYVETHDTGQLLLIITDSSLNNETSFLGEGFAAGLAFLGQAADVRSSIYFVPQGPRFIPFAKMVYGKQYISTGSSVNVKGFSAIAGLALNTNFDNGSQLVVGAFVEGGWGDYNSRNSFGNAAVVNGKGDTEYYGGGLLARYATAKGLYGEGTFAAGKAETDFRTYDFVPGTRSKYDCSVSYYSSHLTVGQVLNLTDMLELDVYGKYLWTRQAGDNVTVDGYRFKFKAADSHRLRAGGKLKADVSQHLQPYIGAAYEYEFSGKIKGSLYGMNLDEPSLRGSTGIGELGMVWSPTESSNFKIDLGAQGYVGKREGVSGGLTVSLSF